MKEALGAVPSRRLVVLVGGFRSMVPEGKDGPFGSQGGFVDTLAPEPYSLGTACLKSYLDTLPEITERFRIKLVNLSEPLHIEDQREELLLEEEQLEEIAAERPDVVGFSTLCWNLDAFLDAAQWLKKKLPKLVVLFGGRGIDGESKTFLEEHPCVDALVLGEGELPLRDILLGGLDDEGGVRGVLHRRGGALVDGGPPQRLLDLDLIPSPFLSGLLQVPTNGVMMEFSRGCAHSCGYCTWNADKHLRMYSPERMEQTIAWALEQGHEHITLVDSAINYRSADLEGFVDAVRRADPKGRVHFTYNLRHDRIDERQLAALSRLPTHMVLLGVETLVPTSMEEIDRVAVDREELRGRLRAVSEAVRPPVASIVLGLPADTEDAFEQTLQTLLSWTEPDTDGVVPVGTVLVSLLQVYRGSALWERREELGLRFLPQGIPYLLESPNWSRQTLARCKARLVQKMVADPERLKGAEAIALLDRAGGVDPWLSQRRLASVLAPWGIGESREGWKLEHLGLARDTGDTVILRYLWREGGRVRIRVRRTPDSGPRQRLRFYSLDLREGAGPLPSGASEESLMELVHQQFQRGERVLVERALEHKQRLQGAEGSVGDKA